MKKRKWLLVLLCVGLLLLCYSCGLFGWKKYECDTDTVKSIQVVKLDESEQEGEDYKYTVLATVSDHKTFFDKLNSIRQSENWGEPRMILSPCIVLKIEFQNGDVDLLTHYAQERIRSDVSQLGYITFNEKQFSELIYDYYPHYYLSDDSTQPDLPPQKQ